MGFYAFAPYHTDMRSSISRQSRAVVHLCSACRRDATQTARRPFSSASRSGAAAAAAAAPGAPRLNPNPNTTSQAAAPLSTTRRWLSQTSRPQQPAAVRSSSSSAAEPEPGTSSSPDTNNASGHRASVAGESETRDRPGPPSFYALFPETLPAGPPPAGSFHIDARALRREFLRLQAAAHPDVNSGAGGASALINEAYRTLVNPLTRAQYLLRERFGVDVVGDEAGMLWEPEPEVLAAVMEAREEIEEAGEEGELEGLREVNEGRVRAAEEVLGEAFARGDVEAAKREVVRLRYWINVRESIHNWESGKPVVLEH